MSYTRRRPRSMRGARGNNSPAPPPTSNPVVTSISQTAGKAAGGSALSLVGKNYLAGMTAPLTGGGTLGSLSAITSTTATLTTGAHAAGAVTWHLLNTDSGISPDQTFTYLAAPVVSAISPNNGPATLANNARTITCSGLPPLGSGVTVSATVGGNSVTSLVNNGDGTITGNFASHSAGATDVIVTVDGVASSGGTGLYTFNAVPTITSFTYVTSAGGTSYGIGTGFIAGATISVNINGTPTSLTGVVVSGNGTQIQGTLPSPGPYTTGNWNVTVTNPDTQSATGTSLFTVFASSTIAGLMWDLDFNAGVSQSGGFLTGITDQSSNAYTFAPVAGSSIAYTTNALNGYPAATGNGSTGLLLSSGNVTQSTKSTTVFVVMKVDPSTSNATVIFEQTNNSKASAGVNGYRVEYLSNGPQLDVSSGTTSGSSLNEVYVIAGPQLTGGYQAYCFVFDRAATFPVTITGATPAYERTHIGAALAGQGYITAGSSASNYDTAPLSLFARNVSGAASAASKTSIVRAFAYNTALSQATRQNVLQALASQYGTDKTPATAQVMWPGDSLSSVFDTNASLSASTYIYVNSFYDNLQLDISAISGWTLANIYANRVAIFTSRRSDIPVYVVIWGATNDFASSDTLAPGDLYNNTLAPLCDYVAGLSAPAIAGIIVFDELPRGVVAAGTTASMEAKRVGQDTSGNPLPGYANTHTYSSATPDWILVSDGTHNQLMRCTTGGTSSVASPTWNFTLAGTTNVGGGTIFTCYGRTWSDAVNDATNQANHHYTAVPIGDPTTAIGTFANTNSLTYYLSDKTHLQPTQQTGQAVPTSPSGPPASTSVLGKLVPFFKQGGTFTRTYRAPQLSSISPTSGAQGTPITITGLDFGELAASHSLQINGIDCGAVTRISDTKITAQAPASLAIGGPYNVTYTRVDGQTVTLSSAFTCVASQITSVQVVTGTVAAPLAIMGGASLAYTKNVVTNSYVIQFNFNVGATLVTGLALNGTSLTNVTVINDTTATGILPAGTYTAATGNATASGTMSNAPATLTNGWQFKSSLDPSTTYSSAILRQWLIPANITSSAGTITGWTDASAHTAANSMTTANGSPPVTTSSNFSNNGSGISVVPVGAGKYLTQGALSFRINDTTTAGTPLLAFMVVHCTSDASNGQHWYYLGGGANDMQLTAQSTEKPAITQGSSGTAAWGTGIGGKNISLYAYGSGTGSQVGVAVSDGANATTEVTLTGGTGNQQYYGTLNLGDTSGNSLVGEIAMVIAVNAAPAGTNIITATQIGETWIYMHNETNCP